MMFLNSKLKSKFLFQNKMKILRWTWRTPWMLTYSHIDKYATYKSTKCHREVVESNHMNHCKTRGKT